MEVARRSQDKALANQAVREVINEWYDPATLKLLEGSVRRRARGRVRLGAMTFSAPVPAFIEFFLAQ